MKVVLFCGGRGLRLREHSEAIPKPMVPIGYRPILWHVMRYYAHYGHRDFILCLGYRADAIKDYFLHYSEAVSNDFVLSDGGRQIELLSSDIADWRITFADTGLDTTIGERLRRVRHLLEGEEMFLANYGDTLTDAPLDRLVEAFRAEDGGRLVPGRPAVGLSVPGRSTRMSRSRVHASASPGRRRHLDQRRLLHAAPRDLRRHGARRRARRGAVRRRLMRPGRLRADQVRRVLGPSWIRSADLEQLEAFAAHGRAPWAAWARLESAPPPATRSCA